MSCADVQTIQAGDGTKSEFSFDFPYLFKSEIKVYFWNRVTKEYDEIAQDGSGWGQAPADTIYPWEISDANPTIVHFTEIDSGGNTAAVPPSPAAAVDPNEETVDNVKIRRETSIDDIRALFNPGSAIRSDDLNKNFEQLRYAIQEGNCQGITDDVYEYLKDNYWDRYDNTLYEDDAWVSDDTKIATTAALDKRFQDEVAETITSSESWPDNDDTIATTAAIDNRIDTAITNDIGTDGTGITVTDDGDGTITLGLGAGSIDFDRIKDVDIITQAEQDAGSPAAADNNLFTALAAAKRFDTIVQTTTPSGSDWEVGKSWLQNDADKTFSIWDGDSWEGISSGGTFINQPKVVYVDATNGNDDNDGHRISRPKASIKAAINQINADSTYGDGSIVVVAPGVYREAAPIQIQKRDVSVVGTSLRSCVVHPTQATETNTLFEVNSGTYLKNLTFTGVKASGTRGEAGSLYTDATHGLPATQGWNVAFLAGATIVKSPYIQNCTNFSDSEIDNTDLNFYSGTEDAGRAGDEDSAMTGGGLLVDGSVPAATSPLRSMVCDSYTHVGLDGPGILVTNNGYCQATSSYAFFNHFHIACINGGQANLAASTTDFGRFSLITDGRSPNAIFTSNVDGAADDEAISFNINAPTASTDLYNEAGTENDNAWWGSATRPQPNMLVEVNGVTYPILSATPNTDSEGGAGWTVTISRPDPNNRSTNLGLNGAIADDAAVSFFLRSMIASSGHTMEYVGAGTDYSALPENGGVPNDSNQIIELNNGKVWTAITDHNGKFRIGGNQTTDPIFEVDQQLGFVTIPEGSIAFNLLSDLTPQLGGDLDVNGNTITGLPTTPTADSEATSKAYVDAQIAGIDEVVEDTTPQLGGDLDVNGNEITSASNGNVVINPNGTGVISLDADVGIGTTNPGSADLAIVHPRDATNFARASIGQNVDGQGSTGGNHLGLWYGNANSDRADIFTSAGNMNFWVDGAADGTGQFTFGRTFNTTWMTIDDSGNVGIGTGSPASELDVNGEIRTNDDARFTSGARHKFIGGGSGNNLELGTYSSSNTSRDVHLVIDSAGNVGVGTGSPDSTLELASGPPSFKLTRNTTASTGNDFGRILFENSAGTILGSIRGYSESDNTDLGLKFSTGTSDTIALTIDEAQRVGIGTVSPADELHVNASSANVNLRLTRDTNNGIRINGSDGASPAFIIDLIDGGTISEAARIDSSGRLLVGTSTALTTPAGSRLTVAGDDFATSSITGIRYQDNTNGASLLLMAANGTEASPTSVSDGDELGKIRFYGHDGTDFASFGASIECRVDGTPSENVVPGSLEFWITDDAGASQQRMTIDNEGRLLVGTTSDSGNTTLVLRGNSAGGTATPTIAFQRNITPAVNNDIAIISFSNVTGGEGARLLVEADAGWSNGSSHPTRLVFSTTDSSATTPTERMRITKEGRFHATSNAGDSLRYGNATNHTLSSSTANEWAFVVESNNDTSPWGMLIDYDDAAPDGTSNLFMRCQDSGATRVEIRSDGDIWTSDSGILTSDATLKRDITDATPKLDDLMRLRVRNFYWTPEYHPNKQDKKLIGFIAQEVEEVFPGLVSQNNPISGGDPIYDEEGNDTGEKTPEVLKKGLKEGKLIPILVKALQEAVGRIETLEAEVAALKGA